MFQSDRLLVVFLYHLCLPVSYPACSITSSDLEYLAMALWDIIVMPVINSMAPKVEKNTSGSLADSNYPINIC